MQVQFGINIGSRDAQVLGLDFTECVKGAVLDLPADTVKQIKALCGEASVSDVVVEAPKAKAAKDPTEAELDKLNDPKKGK